MAGLVPAIDVLGHVGNRHCEPTGRANARPMTGSAKSGTLRSRIAAPDFAELNPGYKKIFHSVGDLASLSISHAKNNLVFPGRKSPA
jgi:hypothetical protein